MRNFLTIIKFQKVYNNESIIFKQKISQLKIQKFYKNMRILAKIRKLLKKCENIWKA